MKVNICVIYAVCVCCGGFIIYNINFFFQNYFSFLEGVSIIIIYKLTLHLIEDDGAE